MSYISANTPTGPRIAILGIGNWLMGDDGVGIHLIRALGEYLPGYDNVTVIDGGTSPDAMLLIDDVDRLIILDAINGGLEPGTVYRFTGDDIERQISPALSLHEWSAADSLTAMQLTGRMPRDVVVIGVEPERVSWDTRLSATIQSRLPQIISVVLKEIQASKLAGRN